MSNLVIRGINDVFLTNVDDNEDTISLKKVLKKEGSWDLIKEVLGYDFYGNPQQHTIWMNDDQQEKMIQTLKESIRGCRDSSTDIPFDEFYKVIEKMRHAFLSILAGYWFMSPCNALLGENPNKVYLHHNKSFLESLLDACHLLQISSESPTPCKEIATGCPHYIGVKDALSRRVGGIIIG